MSLKNLGNKYTLVHTASGIPTFRHLATNEILHGQVGPYEEALSLYVGSSKIEEKKGECVVYDAGMGCGAQLIAMYHAFLSNNNLSKLTVVSFDLEKEGLVSLLQHKNLFSYINKFDDLLSFCLEKDHLTQTLDDGRVFEWVFVQGDFVTTVAKEKGCYPLADIICYDFFSPASQPQLWVYDVFINLKKHVNKSSLFITYSSATCIRAVLLAAGFYVGFGIVSGKKARSTLASPNCNLIEEPLPSEWKMRFQRSQAKYSSSETELAKIIVEEKVSHHSQWEIP